MISTETSLAQLLTRHPELTEALARLHPGLAPLLGKPMAARLTVAEAAAVAGVTPEELLVALRRTLGETVVRSTDQGPGCGPTYRSPASSQPKPPHLDSISRPHRLELDVREDIRAGREPFGRIMSAAQSLTADQVLVLRAPFEPVPLFEILGKKGLDHWSDCHAPGDWSVWFFRPPATAASSKTAGSPRPGSDPAEQVLHLDVRGLEPPLPMARVLELLEKLRPGQRLEVLHERRPIFLYPQIEERGFAHETDEPEPGTVRIVIRRPAGG